SVVVEGPVLLGRVPPCRLLVWIEPPDLLEERRALVRLGPLPLQPPEPLDRRASIYPPKGDRQADRQQPRWHAHVALVAASGDLERLVVEPFRRSQPAR